MGKLTVEGMADVEKAKEDRANALKELISKPFNLNDDKQQATFRKYINDFEYNANLSYLFQGMYPGRKTWYGSWLARLVLPLPEFAHYLLTMFICVEATGYILQNFSISDFHSQLEEMKTIYNWCLKNKQITYDGSTDNTTTLSNPDVQRMIKLMAPLCPTKFMLAWKNVTAEEETKTSIWGSVYNTYSYFTAPKPTVDLNRLQDLKASVERRELDVGIYKGVENAVRYFATDTHFREFLITQVQRPVDQIKSMLPSILTLGHSKSE